MCSLLGSGGSAGLAVPPSQKGYGKATKDTERCDKVVHKSEILPYKERYIKWKSEDKLMEKGVREIMTKACTMVRETELNGRVCLS